jgi:hypothetical protein
MVIIAVFLISFIQVILNFLKFSGIEQSAGFSNETKMFRQDMQHFLPGVALKIRARVSKKTRLPPVCRVRRQTAVVSRIGPRATRPRTLRLLLPRGKSNQKRA